MIEHEVRFCRTSDGVDIAFTTSGQGPALVVPPNIVNSHLHAEIGGASRLRPFFERLAERVTLVRYDPRGAGMSQRDVPVDFSAEAAELDLLAVVDRLGLGRFALYNHVLAGLGPARVATRHPDRVSCLVWWVGQTIAISPDNLRRIESVDVLVDSDWDLYCDIVGRLICGWDADDAAHLADLIRVGSSPALRRAALAASVAAGRVDFGASEAIQVPTLVIHVDGAALSAERAHRIARRIPDAHLLAVPGLPRSMRPIGDDNPILTAAIADFVCAADRPGSRVDAPELQLTAMRAILWTDLVQHTRLMDRHGDAAGRELLRTHERIVRDQLSAHGGTEVKAMGDGFMAWFTSSQRALDCAIALQRAFDHHNATAAEPMRVRVGLNAGEPIEEDDDLFGTSVIAAARICSQADGGEIVVSDVVRQLVAGKGFTFGDRGTVTLKGFEEPVRLATVIRGA